MSILDLALMNTHYVDHKTLKNVDKMYVTRNGEVVGIVDIDKYAEFDQYKTNVEPAIELVSSQYTIEEVEEDAGD